MASKYFIPNLSSVTWTSLEPAVALVTSQSTNQIVFSGGGGPGTAYNGLGATLYYYIGSTGYQVFDSGGAPVTVTIGYASGTVAGLSGTPSISLVGRTVYCCAGTSSPASTDDIFVTPNCGPSTLSSLDVGTRTCRNLTINRLSNLYGNSTSRNTVNITGALSLSGGCTLSFIANLSGSASTIDMTSFTGNASGLSVESTGGTSQLSNVSFGQALVSSGTYTNNGYNITLLSPSWTMSYYGFTVNGGTFNLSSNLTVSDSIGNGFRVLSGTLNLNSYTLSLPVFYAQGTPTINPGTSTIQFTNTFTGAGRTYNNLVFDLSTTDVPVVQDNCTFNTVSNTTPTAGKNTISPGIADSVLTATTFNFNGTPTVPLVMYDYYYATGFWLTKTGGGRVTMNYINFDGVTCSPANTFYAINSKPVSFGSFDPNTNIYLMSSPSCAIAFF